MTGVAVVIFLVTKFLAGAWVVVIAVPLLIWLFSASEHYYDEVATELRLGRNPPLPKRRDSIVIVPTSTVNLVTERALSAAMSLGETVVAVAVAGDEEECKQIRDDWKTWRCAVPLEVLIDPHRSLVRSVLDYIERNDDVDATITVLISEVVPRKPYHEIYHNQRGRVLAAVLRNQTDVVIATLPFRLHD